MPSKAKPKGKPIDNVVTIKLNGELVEPRPALRKAGKKQRADSIRWIAEGRPYYVVFGEWPFQGVDCPPGFKAAPDLVLIAYPVPGGAPITLYLVEVPNSRHSKQFLGALDQGDFEPYGYLPASIFKPDPQDRQAGPEVLGEAPEPVPPMLPRRNTRKVKKRT